MKQHGHRDQPDQGGAPEKGGSFNRGPRPQPRIEPQHDPERDRYGSPGRERDEAGRERRPPPRQEDGYGEFLRDEDSDGDEDTEREDERSR